MAKVTSISISEAGGPYTSPPTITISSPDQDSANATAALNVVNSKVSSVTITSGGNYYRPTDTAITFQDPTEGIKVAKITASIADNAVSSLTIDSGGSYYITTPTIVFSEPDQSAAQATASVLLDSSGIVSAINLVDSGLFYTIVPIAVLNYRIADSNFSTTLDVTTNNSKISSLAIGGGDPVAALALDSASVTIDAPTGAADQFVATATVSLFQNRVESYSITHGGAGYSTAPTVSVEIPTGTKSQFRAEGTLVIDNGVVTAVSITNPGNFYESSQDVLVIPYGTASKDDFRATATCAINDAGEVISVTITDSGNFYNTAPSVLFAAPQELQKFVVGEEVIQVLDDGTRIRGEVVNWNDSSYTLELIHVGANDGKYHSLVTNRVITGQTSDAQGDVATVAEENQLSNNEQNTEFSTESADFLDFTESNPFGDPS